MATKSFDDMIGILRGEEVLTCGDCFPPEAAGVLVLDRDRAESNKRGNNCVTRGEDKQSEKDNRFACCTTRGMITWRCAVLDDGGGGCCFCFFSLLVYGNLVTRW